MNPTNFARNQFITLSNTGSQLYYPDNSNQCFTNNLGRPIPVVGDGHSILEVGLLDLYYTPIQPKASGTIFKPGTDENKILFVKREDIQVYVRKKKEKEDIYTFLIEANKLFKTANMKVTISIEQHDNAPGDTYLALNVDYDDRLVTLDPVYGKALGFDNIPYSKGYTRGAHPIDRNLFSEIEMTKHMTVTAYSDQPAIKLAVEEPILKTAEGLIDSMNASLKEYNVNFAYNGETFDYNNVRAGQVRVQLSRFIEKTFMIPNEYWFDGDHKSFPTYSTIDFGLTTATCVLVECTAACPQQQPNGEYLPIVKRIALPATFGNALLHEQFNPAVYMPVVISPDPVNSIQIRLLDEHYNPIALATSSITTVQIHFRERF